MTDNLVINMMFLDFSNRNKHITLFNIKDFHLAQKNNKDQKENGQSTYIYNTSFILYDSKNNPIKLFTALVDSFESKVLVIYANSVIIDNTLMNLKFYYAPHAKNKFTEIAGQKENYKSNVLLH